MDETKRVNPWVVGGDGRYPWAVRALRQSGLPVKTWGVPEMPNEEIHLMDALQGADLVLLPMRPFQGEMLRIGDEEIEAALLPHLLEKGATLVAGTFPTEIESWLQSEGVFCVSFLDLESYQMANAAVTAEGALLLAMEQMDRTVGGAEALVIGWGRIGKFLAKLLQAMGAHVTATARREGDWAEQEFLGIRPEETGVYHHGLDEYDVVFNTVPAEIMTGEQAEQLKPDCVLIELSSLPGGLRASGRKNIVMAQALPGKTAPRSAGENLSAAVWTCLCGEGRPLE